MVCHLRGYFLLNTTQKMQLVVVQTYSQKGNDAQVYELKKKNHEMDQNDISLQVPHLIERFVYKLDYYLNFQVVCCTSTTKFVVLVLLMPLFQQGGEKGAYVQLSCCP